MNSKVLKFVTLGIGCLCGLLAVFNLISSIIRLTELNTNNEVVVNIAITLIATISLAGAVAFALLAIPCIMPVVKPDKECKLQLFPAAVYGLIQVLLQLVLMIFWHGYETAYCWIVLIFGVGVVVAFVLSMLQSDNKTKTIIALVCAGVAFVLATVCLSNNGGLGLACDIFAMFTMMTIIAYFVLTMIPAKGNSETKKEEPVAKEEVETKEETEVQE